MSHGAHFTVEALHHAGYAARMVVFLRSRGRLRCLLAIALLAWLMLAVAPFGAWAHAASTAPASMAGHAADASMHMGASGCCDDQPGQPHSNTTHSCHCALLCAGVLPSAQAGLAATPMMANRYAPPRPIEAPLTGFAPPLRPPLA